MARLRAVIAGLLAAGCAAAGLTGCAMASTSRPDSTITGDRGVVVTDAGVVRGVVTDDQRRFQAIPYAAAPVGERRWRSPQLPTPWRGVRDGTQPGAPCPQVWPGPDGKPRVVGSEDCLFLNVTTPRALAPPRPVMVFIHGGGFTGGQGAPYDPGRVVAHGDLIVVTLNYRLGALGFLAHPGLGNDPASGNFGLADQQEALRWVRRNIAAFGGDPGNVTLWGESAGGFSVCAQLAAPGARGLFQKAIIQSAPCANPLLDRSSAERRGISTAAEVGCLSPDPARTVDCLRAKPIESLAGRYDEQVYQQVHRDLAQVPWLPVVGTATLPSNPLDALRADRAADVPTLLGGTRDEMRQQVAQAYDQLGHPITAEQYPRVLEALFGAAADAVVAAYPAAAYPSPGVALATALTDEGRFVGACSQRPLIAAVRAPVFSYEFAEPVDEVIGTIPLGADHGADVPYFFDSLLPGAPRPSRTAAQDGLARRLIGYWTSFAASGVPGSDWVPATGGRVLQLDGTAARPIDIGAAHRCDLWDRMRPP